MRYEWGINDELAMDKGEAEVLYGLVRAIKPKVCLEIGTHKGFSTQYILEALIDNEKGHLHTTDVVDFEVKKRVLFEHREKITFHFERGDQIKISEPVDFVFIDALHTIDDVIPEIKNVWPQLASEAVVVFHDAQNDEGNLTVGVNAAIKACKLQTTWIPSKYCLQIYQHKKL